MASQAIDIVSAILEFEISNAGHYFLRKHFDPFFDEGDESCCPRCKHNRVDRPDYHSTALKLLKWRDELKGM